ncbi:hypothetical protein [Sinorhizobium medicae]|uniref:hypothetical protein n=1 Tax=Sinorhizobium medicae TaxID=110321 RepID=UPI003969C7F1
MHRSTGFRSDIAVHPQALVSLELKDVIGAVAEEEHERNPRKPVEAIGEAVLSAVDLSRNGLTVPFVGLAV